MLIDNCDRSSTHDVCILTMPPHIHGNHLALTTLQETFLSRLMKNTQNAIVHTTPYTAVYTQTQWADQVTSTSAHQTGVFEAHMSLVGWSGIK